MLAYVFWHAPEADADLRDYEAQLERFHHALAQADVAGYLRSHSFRVRDLPWLPQPHGYEDWYFLEDSAALDRLNASAVSAAQAPHDKLAAASRFGAGGLYRHCSGLVNFQARHAFWFGKPEGLTYSRLYEMLEHLLPGSASLWQRQMVLGPGAEFCAFCDEDLPLAAPLAVVRVARTQVGT